MPSEARLSQAQIGRAAVLAIAFLLCLIAVFTPWWTVKVSGFGASSTEDARPFSAGNFCDGNPQGDNLCTEVIVTGILAVLAALGTLALLVADLLPLAGRTLPRLYGLTLSLGVLVLGLVAVLYTTLVWPRDVGNNLSFFDEASVAGFRMQTYAGVGWYLEILGAIVLTAAGLYLSVRARPAPPYQAKLPVTDAPAAPAPPPRPPQP